MPAHTLREPMYLRQEDNGLTVCEEANGQFTIRREDYGQQVELDADQFADLISAGAQRLGLRFEKPAPILRFSDAVAAARGVAKREAV